jgi:hypothetical protein
MGRLSELKSLHLACVDDVITARPKTVRPDQLASEALQILNDMKITAYWWSMPASRSASRTCGACVVIEPACLR